MAEGDGGVQASVGIDATGIDTGLARLRAAVKDSELAMQTLKQGLDDGSLSVLEYADKLRVLQSEHKKLETASRSLENDQRKAAEAYQATAAAAERLAAAQSKLTVITPPAANPTATQTTGTYDIVGQEGYAVEQSQRATAANERTAKSFLDVATNANNAAARTFHYGHVLEEISTNATNAEGATRRLTATTRQLDSAQGQVNTKASAGARAITDFSRAAEDFSTGGFLGVMNNIPGVLTNTGQALGVAANSLSIFVSVASLAAAGGYLLYKNWDQVSQLWQTRNPFPSATSSLEAMTEAVKRNEESLDKLRKNQSLTNDQLAEYNRLLKENKVLLEAKEEMQNRQQDVKSLRESMSSEEKERAGALKFASEGVGDEVIGAMTRGVQEEITKRREEIQQRMRGLQRRAAGGEDVSAQMASEEWAMNQNAGRNAGAEAEQMVSDLNRGGKNSGPAWDRLQRMLRGGADRRNRFPSNFRNRLQESQDEFMTDAEKTDLADWDADVERFEASLKDRSKAVDNRNRKARETKQKANAAKQKENEEKRAAKEEAERLAPGLDVLAEQGILETRAGGSDAETAYMTVQADVTNALIKNGMKPDQAKLAAEGIADKAAQSVQEKIVRTRLGIDVGKGQRQEVKHSEVFASADLSNRIQAGISNTETPHQKKIANLTELMLKALADKIPQEIAKIKVARPTVKR